jgi:AbrB family looped-hinge helix DNA binding protein
METAKITSKGQMTIPKNIRETAHLKTGDIVALDIEDNHILMRKVTPEGKSYLHSVQETLPEWSSDEDEAAWRDL